jgi:hypothetical protein
MQGINQYVASNFNASNFFGGVREGRALPNTLNTKKVDKIHFTTNLINSELYDHQM